MKNVFSPTCPHRAGVSGARRGTGTPGLYVPTTVSSMLSSSSARNTMNRMSFRECRLSCSRRSSASSLRAMAPGLGCGRGARSGVVRGRRLPRPQGSPGPARRRGARAAGLPWRRQTVPGVPPRLTCGERVLTGTCAPGVKRPRAPSGRDPPPRPALRRPRPPHPPRARKGPRATRAPGVLAFPGPLGTPRVAPPGASPDLGRAPLSRASGRRSVPSAESRGRGAGSALPRGGLRLPALAAVGSVWPAGSGRSLHPSARPPPLSLPGPALTSRPARGGGGGLGRPGLRPPGAVAFLSPPRPGPGFAPGLWSRPVPSRPSPLSGHFAVNPGDTGQGEADGSQREDVRNPRARGQDEEPGISALIWPQLGANALVEPPCS